MPIRKKISRLFRRITGDLHKPTAVYNPPSAHTPVNAQPVPPVPPSKPKKTNLELILYGRPSCPYCARVDRVIEALHIEDQITRRLTTYGSQWRTDLKTKTGSTQVPCLFIDGEPMFESLDIIDWMQTHFG